MATGYGSSFQQASDMIYDYICSPCEDDNLNAEALYYCKHCLKQYCDTCENFHKKFHKHHVVLGKAEVQNWGPVKTENALEYCEDHPGERIKTYCKDHDAVCCSDCVSVKHRSCKSVSYISDVAAGFHQTPEYQRFLATVNDMIKQLNDTEQSKKKDINDLIESRKQILYVIQQLKSKLIQQLDDIETRTIKELDDLLKTTNDAIIEDLNRCRDIHDDLKKYLDGLQHKRTTSDTITFIGYRKCDKKMTEAKGLFKEIALKPTGKIVFKEDPEIEKFLASVQTFGQLQFVGSTQHHTQSHPSAVSKVDHVYSVTSSNEYSIKGTEDRKTCSIESCCRLPNGNFVLVDFTNLNAKLVSKDYVVMHVCPLLKRPSYICLVQGDEVIVSFSGSKMLQLMKAGEGKLTLQKVIICDHFCYRVIHRSGQLYVGSEKGLHVYTLTGQMIKTVYGEMVVKFALSDDGERIYVIVKSNCIILDDQGNHVSKFSVSDSRVIDICIGENGYVFLCQFNNTINQFDRDGSKVGTVARGEHSIIVPSFIWFDRKSEQLVVGLPNKILVLQLA